MTENITKPMVIEIVSRQAFVGAEPETMELVTDGTLSTDGDKYLISYHESEVTGLQGTVTTFEVDSKSVTLTREGTVTSQMIFQPGKKHLSLYDMGFGALTIGINAKKVKNALDSRGGTIEIDYAIEIEHMVAGENSFRIKVRESADRTLVH